MVFLAKMCKGFQPSIFLYVLLTLIWYAFNVCNGIHAPNMKIIGGKSINWKTFPFMASIISRVDGNKVKLCGGSIIHSRWVLTAAHCLEDVRANAVCVFIGSTKFADGIRYKVKRLIPHENYDGQSNDIALIELSNSVLVGDGKKIRLNSDNIPLGTEATLVGWGFLSLHQDPRDVPDLHTVTLHVAKCQRNSFIDVIFQEVIIQEDNDNTVICTSTREGKGACVGDSGGPLIAGGKQIGVVSRGAPCATGVPDIYTAVEAFVPWIEKHTGVIFRI